MKKIAILLFIAVLTSSSDCEGPSKQTSESGAEQITFDFKFPLNSKGLTVEQSQIEKRLKVTTDPTKVLWIHLIALDGKIVRRMPVVSKVTSSGKRLEPKTADGGSGTYVLPRAGNGYRTTELIQPDGTYGDSDSYIYWFDPQDRYHQWGTAGGLGYLLTDYPIDLSNPIDEITGMYNMSTKAYEWQKQQEAQLRAQK